ncbi:hypothetical protein [uncultured Methanolobus sp.]|uniref:hypothetical protein n=1 Tax=uncultured Methanolobus sp. TaxID=218300 RepID=UPI002AAB3DAF|nr:hypothetical protein [uncultured Methanolobus sp.]
MQHTKVISFLLSILFLLVLTNVCTVCVADANSTSGNDSLLNVTNASSNNLTTQNSRYDNYIEGYDMEKEPMAPLPDSDDFVFSRYGVATVLIVIIGIGSFFLVAMLAVVVIILKSAKKKKN